MGPSVKSVSYEGFNRKMNTEIQKYRNTEMQKYRNAEMQEDRKTKKRQEPSKSSLETIKTMKITKTTI